MQYMYARPDGRRDGGGGPTPNNLGIIKTW